MGRRALSQIDPQAALEQHFRSLDDWEPGQQVAEAFPNSLPLEVEVGSGKGLFIRNAAQRHSERNFLGIEISRKYARFAAAKLADLDLPNAIMLHGDGEKMLRENVLDGTLEAVHVYFPDPWWKTRHRKRRVMNARFASRISDVLRPGGALHFWTDVEEYFQVTLRLLKTTPALTGPFEVEENEPQHDLDYRTHYERRMRKHGKPIYRSLFRKTASPTV